MRSPTAWLRRQNAYEPLEVSRHQLESFSNLETLKPRTGSQPCSLSLSVFIWLSMLSVAGAFFWCSSGAPSSNHSIRYVYYWLPYISSTLEQSRHPFFFPVHGLSWMPPLMCNGSSQAASTSKRHRDPCSHLGKEKTRKKAKSTNHIGV